MIIASALAIKIHYLFSTSIQLNILLVELCVCYMMFKLLVVTTDCYRVEIFSVCMYVCIYICMYVLKH